MSTILLLIIATNNVKFPRSDLVFWTLAIAADAYTTYEIMKDARELGVEGREYNILFNFDERSKYGEILAQMFILDVAFRYLTFKLTGQPALRVSITAHGIAVGWNLLEGRRKQ